MAEIWTIGHSTRRLSEFKETLRSFQLSLVADVRSFPGSHRAPQFNRERLLASLPAAGFQYQHFPELGGRSKGGGGAASQQQGKFWKLPAFSSFIQHANSSQQFRQSLAELESTASAQRTVLLCCEFPWWECHRRVLADWLLARGWAVWHIFGQGRAELARQTLGSRYNGEKGMEYGVREGETPAELQS